MKFAARLFFSVFLLFLFLFFKPSFVSAQTAQTSPNLHNYTQNVMIETLSSMACLLAGVDIVNPNEKCLGIADGKIGPVDAKGGAIGAMGNMIGMTFYIPVSTGDYFHYLAQNFGVAKPAYAQNTPNGVGFAGIKPLLNIWTNFRNITYLFFVVVFVVIGFAIMLRIHIDPRTVMTIENQIPKIIIGLILVTFSFALSGFLIDLMYVLLYLFINVFATIDPTINKEIAQVTNPIQAVEKIGGVGAIAQKSADTAGAFFAPVFDNPPGKFLLGLAAGLIGRIATGGVVDLLGGAVSAFGGPAGIALKQTLLKVAQGPLDSIAGSLVGIFGYFQAPAIAGLIGGIIAFIVITVAMLTALFRLWFELLKTYVFLLIDIVLAPFWIIAGLLPGSSVGFTAWLRDLIANLSAFPVTIAMFLLGRTIIDGFNKATSDPFVPPLVGNPAGQAIGSFIGLGIILLTPQVVSMIKAALKAPEFKIPAVSQSIGAGVGYPLGVFRRMREARERSQQFEIVDADAKGKVVYGQRGWLGSIFRF